LFDLNKELAVREDRQINDLTLHDRQQYNDYEKEKRDIENDAIEFHRIANRRFQLVTNAAARPYADV
jgi:hypothetical protein